MEFPRVNFLFYTERDGQRNCQIVLGGAAVASEAILRVYASGGTMFDASCCDLGDLPRKSIWWETSILSPYFNDIYGTAEAIREAEEELTDDAAGGALFELIP